MREAGWVEKTSEVGKPRQRVEGNILLEDTAPYNESDGT